VPEPIKTTQLCLAAVNQSGSALCYVPDTMKTPELCFLAVNQDGRSFNHVPEAIITPQLCLQAVNQNGLALYHVPLEMRTFEMCKSAIRSNPKIITRIDDSHDLDVAALLEIQDEIKLDALMGSERRKKASRFLDDELTKGGWSLSPK